MKRGHTRWAVVAALLTSLGTVPSAATATTRADAAHDLVDSGWRTAYLSPDGDGRRDRARIPFHLARSARVTVRVRDEAGVVRGPVHLGRLAAGPHRWTWNGRLAGGRVAPDGNYRVRLTATAGHRIRSTTTYAVVDTVRPQGELVSSRPTVHPTATVVDDRVQLTWVLEGWNPFDQEFFPEDGRPARTTVEVATSAGEVVWRRSVRRDYTPTFAWDARTDDGEAVPAGAYVARVTASDRAGNRQRDSQDLTVSHEQLVEQTWTTTVSAADAGHVRPYYGGCNGCGDVCSPVPSERYPGGLSFRPCTSPSDYATLGLYGSDVPFVEAPVDSYRITATGGPTTPGGDDQGSLSGTATEPDGSTSTPWQAVRLTGRPFLPDQDRPVTWSFTTDGDDSYDLDTFTVDYRYYVPEG